MNQETDYSEIRFAVADDKAFIRNIILRMLRQGKAREVLLYENGEQVIKALNKGPGRVDVLISDWNMLPVNGIDLLRGIRMGAYENIARDHPFIMLTGHASPEIVKPALALDVDGYLVKPVSTDKLKQTIERALGRQWTPKAPEVYARIGTRKVDQEQQEANEPPSPSVVSLTGHPKKEWLEEKIAEIRAAAKADMGAFVYVADKAKREPLVNVMPGQILVEDIKSDDGTLLMSSGTTLQQTLLDRLHEIETESDSPILLWVGG